MEAKDQVNGEEEQEYEEDKEFKLECRFYEERLPAEGSFVKVIDILKKT